METTGILDYIFNNQPKERTMMFEFLKCYYSIDKKLFLILSKIHQNHHGDSLHFSVWVKIGIRNFTMRINGWFNGGEFLVDNIIIDFEKIAQY